MKTIIKRIAHRSVSVAFALALITSLGGTFALASDGSKTTADYDGNFETIYVDVDIAEFSEFGEYVEMGTRGQSIKNGSQTVNLDGGKIKCTVNYSITYLTDPSPKTITAYSASVNPKVTLNTTYFDGVQNIKLTTTRQSNTTLRFTIKLDACIAQGQTNAGTWVERTGYADVSV